MELTSGQAEAVAFLKVAYAAGHKVCRMTGLAGTGKTRLALHLPELLGWTGNVLYAAPTPRAGTILRHKAASAGVRIRPITVWKLARSGRPDTKHCAVCLLRMVDNGMRCHVETDPGPRCRTCGELDRASCTANDASSAADHIIIDEASMVGREDYDDVIKATIGCRTVLLIGDPGQLKPIKGDGWSALVDPEMPTAHLTQIKRQAGDSPIIQAAYAVRDAPDVVRGVGVLPPMTHPDAWFAGAGSADVVDQWAIGGPGTPKLNDFAIITKVNEVRVERNNYARRFLFGPDAAPVMVGEIVRSRFLSPKLGLTSDTLCQVTRIREQGGTESVVDLVTEFGNHVLQQTLKHADLGQVSPSDGRWLYAYALTVDAAQGSEFRRVAYHLGHADDSHIAYTALTRASERVMVVPPPPRHGRGRGVL